MDEQHNPGGQPNPDVPNQEEKKYKPERDRNGHWKRGCSGNPAGRKSGRNKVTQHIMDMLEGDAERLSRKAVELRWLAIRSR